MKVLVVDDEPLARDRLIRLMQDMDTIDGAGVATNGIDALHKLSTSDYDVVLLDIKMPGQSGLDVAEQIKKMPNPPAVIFCTAYDEYALDAFRVNAHSYLLKPIQRQALVDALQGCQALNRAQVQALSSTSSVPSISFQNGREKERLPLSDIYYFRADQKYVSLYCERGERIVDASLKVLEEQYANYLVRIHRNCLVYRPRVEKLYRDKEGGFWLNLKGVEAPLAVSRRHAKDLKLLFD